MKSQNNILLAFILNLLFSIIEFFGGILTNSISIISDSIHDFGDALSIGISYILEKKSKKKPDDIYTFGYMRYSILGAIITNTILIIGSVFVIINGINRIINPISINYNGMLFIAIFGVIINLLAVYFTKDGHTHNQKAVNLHILEDVLGWIVVLVGSLIIKYTNIYIIDSIMSIGVAIFIMFNAIKSYKDIIDLFLEKIPNNINIEKLKKYILKIDNIKDVHHIHIWSIDGINNYATMHIVTNIKDIKSIKKEIKEKLKEKGISHVTLEIEDEMDKCNEMECHIDNENYNHSHNHLHHH